MIEIQPVNVISCVAPKSEGCIAPCPMSGTDICCRECASPVHQKQILEYIDEPRLASKLIAVLTSKHKCKYACSVIAST